ncbi:SIMPL domain-containing protein [Capnocytophaga felis]|uniref:Oxidative stress defense protein n=1 Tax=Capnocytophaga felis TaxID=2267611 RepID=A0A5M4B9K6_9FLAO|nr:SIMPL domain-containing protein [Capnocytophaga felis]GET46293.1 oxidative stress defense protein [Capnocytophaga felis]GET48123.1 oxidative stress defense protein [Capnocytophaga felis]
MKLFLLLFALVSTTISAQSIPAVNVTGEGTVYVTPDIVNISLSIENEGNDVKYLKQKNADAVAKVIQILTDELPLENFRTSHVSLTKYYDHNTKTYKYYISQGIKIKLEDISKYESLMEAIFEAGVNQIDNIAFDVKNRENFLREARLAAVEDARQKALFYAVSLDQNIGKALSVSELSSTFGTSLNAEFMAASEMKSSAKETLAVGNIAITAKINVSFELLLKQ